MTDSNTLYKGSGSIEFADKIDGEPTIKRQKTEVFLLTWKCPENTCSGEMVFTGYSAGSNYYHSCDQCGLNKYIENKKYPRTVYSVIK